MHTFKGPLFIIGLPRSGTKLLRDLLNNHPLISIPEVESHFIPYFIKQFGRKPGFTKNPEVFDRFYNQLVSSAFYYNFKLHNISISKEELSAEADIDNWQSVFKFLLMHFSPKKDALIWGDKTPGYLNHIPLLQHIFPDARFIHIVRDPRDYAVSVKNIWGKNIFRAADIWEKTLDNYDALNLRPSRSIIVNYEDLVIAPEKSLQKICFFLDINFLPDMLSLKKPSENYGFAKGSTGIVKTSVKNFERRLTKPQVEKIESLTYDNMLKYNYIPLYAKAKRELSPVESKLLHIYDGLMSYKFHIQEKGFLNGTSYFFELRNKSSWRS